MSKKVRQTAGFLLLCVCVCVCVCRRGGMGVVVLYVLIIKTRK